MLQGQDQCCAENPGRGIYAEAATVIVVDEGEALPEVLQPDAGGGMAGQFVPNVVLRPEAQAVLPTDEPEINPNPVYVVVGGVLKGVFHQYDEQQGRDALGKLSDVYDKTDGGPAFKAELLQVNVAPEEIDLFVQ